MKYISHTLVKPESIEARLYQEVLVTRIIEKGNTLVVAPTALGKTIVAVMLAAYVLEKNPQSKILFMAPTKPLAVQHEKSFKKFLSIEEEKIISMTGSTPAKQREAIYKEKTIINATPQTIENDLLSGKLSLKDFGLVIFDEAHRAVGDYAYVFVALQLQKQNPNCLILGLTASPGSEEEHIQDVCRNLFIKNIEIKDQNDADVKPYVNEIEIDWVRVDLPQEFLNIKQKLEHFQTMQLRALKGMGFALTENRKYYNKFRLLEMQSAIRKRLISHGRTQPSLYFASSRCAAMLKVSHAEELIETQGIGALKNYFEKLLEEAHRGKSKAARAIAADEEIKSAITLTNKLFGDKVQHPKYAELKKIVLGQLRAQPESKIIVFNHYRDSIREVVEFLGNNKEGALENGDNPIKATKFIGQATKGTEKGMSQKLQQEILEELRSGKHNVLVTSSLHPDELIILQGSNGQVTIKKIGQFVDEFIPQNISHKASQTVNGWKVLSSNGKEASFKDVTHVHKHARTNSVLRVKLSSGFDTLVTENHSLVSFDNNANQKSQTPELNSFIELVGNVPNYTNITELDLIKELVTHTPTKELEKLFCSIQGITQPKMRSLKSDLKVLASAPLMTSNRNLAKTTFLDESTITHSTQRLSEEGFVKIIKNGKQNLLELTELGKEYTLFLEWFFSNVSYHKGKYRCQLIAVQNAPINPSNFCKIKIGYNYGKTPISTTIKVTVQLAKFLGFYVAEGHARKTKQTSSIHLAAQKKTMQDEMEKSVKDGLGLKLYRNWRGIDINSQISHLLINYAFRCGRTAYEKEVPECIFNAPTPIKWAFLEAYCKGDGHRARNRIQLTTVSRKLVTGLVLLLRQLGIKKVRVQKNPLHTQYQIEIYESLKFHKVTKNKGKRAYYNTKPTALISEKAYSLFQNKYERKTKSLKSRTFSESKEDILYDYIKEIKPLDQQPEHVYDISVNENETFCGGNGLMTLHNSVAEEGLDIPSVELVVFFEPVPSEIRTIQRRGRTGRFGKGKAIILMARNTRDEAFYWSSRAKERKMKETLHEMKRNEALPQQTLLSTFAENPGGKIIIFVDSREQASSVTKELFGKENVKTIMKPLDVGDYILSRDVCVERKTVEDFISSMIDGRLFSQLMNMRQNYVKPLVMLEGNLEELFTLRNIHRNSIIGALTSIALDYQVPVLNTKNPAETAEYLYVIAKREQLGADREVRLRVGRKGLTLTEQQRFIVEGLPLVGPLLAKGLLEKFGSIKAIANADEKELQAVEGLGKKKARLIRKVLSEKFDEKKTVLAGEGENEELEEVPDEGANEINSDEDPAD